MGRVPNKTGRSWTIGITLLGTNITYPLTKGTFESRTFLFLRWDTPWKINMEPTKHPFGKENDLPNLHDYVPC